MVVRSNSGAFRSPARLRLLVAMALHLVVVLVAGNGWTSAALAFADPSDACTTAIAQAERERQIPAHLLGAIARAESGRFDPVTKQNRAWPWTVMAEGKGRYFDTKRKAIAAVRALQRRGISNIDIGCMQINMYHHSDAFTSLDQAFDPGANTAYAARFLASLHTETGSWELATGRYHSATPEFNRPYRKKVMGMWAEARGRAAPAHDTGAVGHNAATVAVIAGSRRTLIDHDRIAILNERFRETSRRGGNANRTAARSRLPLVSVAQSRSAHHVPGVVRGGRHQVAGSTINSKRFASRRRDQLATWRARRSTSAPSVKVVRGDADRKDR